MLSSHQESELYVKFQLPKPTQLNTKLGRKKPQQHYKTTNQTVHHFFSAPTQPNSTKFSTQPYFNSTRRFMQKNSFLYKTVGICVFSTRTGNGTYRTRCLVWLQFGRVSTNKFFPTDTISANKFKL